MTEELDAIMEQEAAQMMATRAITQAMAQFREKNPDYPVKVVMVGPHVWEVFCREVEAAHKYTKQPSPFPLKPGEPQSLRVPAFDNAMVELAPELHGTGIRVEGRDRFALGH